MEANPNTQNSPVANNIRRVLAVMSGKGGVGKSTLAALLAAGLRRAGWQVGLLDADVTGASIPKLFGVRQPPLAGDQGVLIPAMTTGGIKLVSVNLLLEREDDAVIWRGPLISKLIQQFWNDVAWGPLDALVVDLPPGTSDAALTVLQSLPVTGVVMVTTPQDLADMIVRKAANMARQVHKPILGVVENMSYATCSQCGARLEIFGAGRAGELAAAFGAPLLGRMGLDPDLARAGDAGQIESYCPPEFEAILQSLLRQFSDDLA
ncbi:MAG: Mrp/NBP35 family ATP-binding protein [Anaerolineae bacterium]|nr:Mrp/NBP35 family ATP-binding protein [Anaerolineae bacterium]